MSYRRLFHFSASGVRVHFSRVLETPNKGPACVTGSRPTFCHSLPPLVLRGVGSHKAANSSVRAVMRGGTPYISTVVRIAPPGDTSFDVKPVEVVPYVSLVLGMSKVDTGRWAKTQD